MGTQLLINDITTGPIYSVNDISGLPILEVTSDGQINMYNYPNVVFNKSGSTFYITSTPTTGTTQFGTFNIGGGGFSGGTGNFTGSTNGTSLAINESSGYTGNLIDLQVGGITKFNVDRTGSLTIKGGLKLNYTSVTANYSALTTDYTIDCTNNSFSVTLPTASGVTGQVYVIKCSGTASVITVNTTSSQTIDGQLTQTIVYPNAMKVQSNGSNWIII